MNVVKVTTSGQVSIPTEIRKSFKTSFYTCEIYEGGILFRPIELQENQPKKYKYTIDDLKKFSFKGRNPKEKNLSAKIDEIVYLGK